VVVNLLAASAVAAAAERAAAKYEMREGARGEERRLRLRDEK